MRWEACSSYFLAPSVKSKTDVLCDIDDTASGLVGCSRKRNLRIVKNVAPYWFYHIELFGKLVTGDDSHLKTRSCKAASPEFEFSFHQFFFTTMLVFFSEDAFNIFLHRNRICANYICSYRSIFPSQKNHVKRRAWSVKIVDLWWNEFTYGFLTSKSCTCNARVENIWSS